MGSGVRSAANIDVTSCIIIIRLDAESDLKVGWLPCDWLDAYVLLLNFTSVNVAETLYGPVTRKNPTF